jgi:hypothetical protein
MLKNNTMKESSVYKKLVLDLDKIIFADLLFKYARNTACRIHGKAELWGRAGFLLEGTQA